MYQQAPQQNYQPQYAPQYGGQNFQPNQNAPSQYVSHAPSGMQMEPPQPVMMNGDGRGPNALYRGQGPPNPCICCKFCCGGTCSLKTGVIVIGILNIISAVAQVIRALVPPMRMDPILNVPYAMALLFADGVIFWLLTGVLMLVGAFCLESVSSTLSGVIMMLGGLYHLCIQIYFGNYLVMHNEIEENTLVAVFTFIGAVTGGLFRCYLGYCAYALGKQIRNGEYSKGMPQPMMNVQPTYSTAPMNVANSAQPNPSNTVAVNQVA